MKQMAANKLSIELPSWSRVPKKTMPPGNSKLCKIMPNETKDMSIVPSATLNEVAILQPKNKQEHKMVLNEVQIVPYNQSNLAQMVTANKGKIDQSTNGACKLRYLQWYHTSNYKQNTNGDSQ
jgi:hypothetical protein